MCDCIEQTEIKFREHLKENDVDFKDVEIDNIYFQNKSYLFNKDRTELTLPCKIEWTHITKKNNKKINKHKTQYFTVRYCPFCGEKQE